MELPSLPTTFLFANAVLLVVILIFNRFKKTRFDPPQRLPDVDPTKKPLKATDILGWEFEYARTTASEAMQDRHTMINFYLVVVAVVASGVTTLFAKDSTLPNYAGTLLLWILCGVGWLYFLKIIRLREAWHESARTMNQIKEFFFQYSQDFDQEELRKAFRWQRHTMPPPNQTWNVFFYSAMLIGFLNSVDYTVGSILMTMEQPSPGGTWAIPFGNIWPLVFLGILFFGLHSSLYFAFLKPKSG